ncbi:MAG: LamG-like jellyroll fold domain-containing protein [Planctomycetota bacterium]
MRRRGFTLIEILVTISLIAVLMGLGVGLIQRAGTGNLLTQTVTAGANLLATARASAFGSASAYVTVDTLDSGGGEIRVFRQRPVFTWHCENFEDASVLDVIKRSGGVDVVENAPVPSMQGRHIQFDGGSRVTLADRPWQQFVEGFSIECRINVPTSTTRQNMQLFRKGTAFEVNVIGGDSGRYGIEAKIRLAADEDGKGAGMHVIRTGERGGEQVIEWENPILAGRWYDVRISYDRNRFQIQIDGAVRGERSDKGNAMKPATGDASVDMWIGDSYEGGFDSLQIGGIYEDSDDRYEIAESIYRIDENGKRLSDRVIIYFRNRQLDPRRHSEAVELQFEMEGGESGRGARRRMEVGLSGEARTPRPGE